MGEVWTTICSDHWSYNDASVVCNQLGYSPYGIIIIIICLLFWYTVGAIPASGYYTEYVWSIGIVNPNCTGSETSVFNCSHNQTGSCSPSHDASVICQGMLG